MQLNSIKSKVMLLFLAITVVVVMCMSLLMKFGFDQGFTQYKKSLEKQLSDRMVNSLETHYKEQQSWDAFIEEPRLWHELVYNSSTDTVMNEVPYKSRKPPRKSNRNPDHKRPRKGPSSERVQEKKHRRKPNKNHELGRVLPAFTLFNQQQQKVIGPVDWDSLDNQIIEIKHQLEIAGFLVFRTNSGEAQLQDKQFNQTIWMVLVMICGVMLVVALIFTLPVTNYLIKPIKALSQATEQAAAGDYSVRTSIIRNDELGQLAQNFNVLTDTLQSNSAVHKKMMADISHELRTPVAVLLAEIEAIQDGIHTADEKNLNLLHQQINALKHLINDLHQLNLTDLGSMQYKMQAIDITDLMDDVIQSVRTKANKKHITIKQTALSKKLMVLGDNNRLQQLFSNLLNNSISYTDSNGIIEVVIQESDNGKDHEVIVQDSAPGLKPHELAQIFDRLYRKESSRNKKLGGSGLGMAISKNIVEAHQGSIEANPSSLGGVKITVRLPKNV